MTSAAVPDQYRVTVISPRKRVDLALPAHVSFADLFPGIALYAGLDRAAVAEAPEGWALQRLGEPPFEPPATPAQAGMADGELLYLRPWRQALPPVVSDDIADEIAGVHTFVSCSFVHFIPSHPASSVPSPRRRRSAR